MWRTVSFVERVEVEFSGSIFNQAITLGDFDNDKGNELAVGNIDGDLCIFKGKGSHPWRKCSDLGMITCIGHGNLFSKEKIHLVCLTAEGWCHVFDVKPDRHEEDKKDRDREAEDDVCKTMKPFYSQHLPPNGKVMTIDDVDGDGKVELVVGYSDRVVRLFRWHPSGETTLDMDPKGTLIQEDKWQLAGQIGSITTNISKEGTPQLLASQPGGTYVILLPSALFSLHGDGQSQGHSDGRPKDSLTTNFVYDPLVSSMARNSNVSTEIIGAIRKEPITESSSTEMLYSLCTLDGTLMLVENGHILWSLQVDHQLFSINKLDVTGNGKEEVVCCAWDGQTYIVNHSREVVRYQFEDSVAAFKAGHYAVAGNDNVPCFLYATFNNKIYIYYNIRLPQMASTNLLEVMDKEERTHELLSRLNIKAPTTKDLRELYHWCLYGQHSKTRFNGAKS
ncbi:hypothetical protein ACJMK2_020446 [Sinanodonta woodiana]|uniref:Integrin alpha FG-GAP repeat containing 2 n=1 Tax=Sinanodonta woodiana TaxID=1069815 RepID=A0ABD3U1M3_SINWO